MVATGVVVVVVGTTAPEVEVEAAAVLVAVGHMIAGELGSGCCRAPVLQTDNRVQYLAALTRDVSALDNQPWTDISHGNDT